MSNWLYAIYAVVLGTLAVFTGEIINYVLLGLILIALNNILSILKKIYLQMIKNNEDHLN